MKANEPHIKALLKLLQSWIPLSNTFKKAIHQCMQLQKVTPKKELHQLDTQQHYAWYSIDCWIAEYQTLPIGKEEVYAIYPPKQVFTEISSFLQQTTTKHKFIIISGRKLLCIDRSHFLQLRNFPETPLLLEHYLLQHNERDNWRLELMTYSDYEKVKHFAERYPINQLPAKISASYLRMTPSRFSGARLRLNREK